MPSLRRPPFRAPFRASSRAIRLLPLAAAALLAACGPHLEPKAHEVHRYASEVRCAQGPYEFTVKMSGARWGEGVRLIQVSGAPLSGTAEIWVDGQKKLDWQIYVPTPAAPAAPAGTGTGTTSAPKPPEDA